MHGQQQLRGMAGQHQQSPVVQQVPGLQQPGAGTAAGPSAQQLAGFLAPVLLCSLPAVPLAGNQHAVPASQAELANVLRSAAAVAAAAAGSQQQLHGPSLQRLGGIRAAGPVLLVPAGLLQRCMLLNTQQLLPAVQQQQHRHQQQHLQHLQHHHQQRQVHLAGAQLHQQPSSNVQSCPQQRSSISTGAQAGCAARTAATTCSKAGAPSFAAAAAMAATLKVADAAANAAANLSAALPAGISYEAKIGVAPSPLASVTTAVQGCVLAPVCSSASEAAATGKTRPILPQLHVLHSVVSASSSKGSSKGSSCNAQALCWLPQIQLVQLVQQLQGYTSRGCSESNVRAEVKAAAGSTGIRAASAAELSWLARHGMPGNKHALVKSDVCVAVCRSFFAQQQASEQLQQLKQAAAATAMAAAARSSSKKRTAEVLQAAVQPSKRFALTASTPPAAGTIAATGHGGGASGSNTTTTAEAEDSCTDARRQQQRESAHQQDRQQQQQGEQPLSHASALLNLSRRRHDVLHGPIWDLQEGTARGCLRGTNGVCDSCEQGRSNDPQHAQHSTVADAAACDSPFEGCAGSDTSSSRSEPEASEYERDGAHFDRYPCSLLCADHRAEDLLLCTMCEKAGFTFRWWHRQLLAQVSRTKPTGLCYLHHAQPVQQAQAVNRQANQLRQARGAEAASASSKQCSQCKRSLQRSAFWRLTTAADGYSSVCAECSTHQRERTGEGIRIRLHANLRRALVGCPADGESRSLEQTLGYSLVQFQRHMEQLLQADPSLVRRDGQQMTWEDWRRDADSNNCWTLGHRKPVSAFDLEDPQQLRECFALVNLFPQLAHANYAEGAVCRGGRSAPVPAGADCSNTGSSSGRAGAPVAAVVAQPAAVALEGARVEGLQQHSRQSSSSKRVRWSEEEVQLLRQRVQLFEQNVLGRNKDGSISTDRMWLRVKHFSSAERCCVDFFPQRDVSQLQQKWQALQKEQS